MQMNLELTGDSKQNGNITMEVLFAAMEKAHAIMQGSVKFVVEHPTLGLLMIDHEAPAKFPYPTCSYLVRPQTAEMLRRAIPKAEQTSSLGLSTLHGVKVFALDEHELRLRARQLMARTMDVSL